MHGLKIFNQGNTVISAPGCGVFAQRDLFFGIVDIYAYADD